jgi:hypothetical protein
MDTTEITASRLYSPQQIFLAAMIGSPVAASWCFARNYRQLGDSGSAQKWLIWGGGGSFILIVLFCMLPFAERFPHYILPLAYSVVLQEVAKRIQGDAVAQHISAGGRLVSWWNVVGISLLFGVAVFGVGLVILYFVL